MPSVKFVTTCSVVWGMFASLTYLTIKIGMKHKGFVFNPIYQAIQFQLVIGCLNFYST